MKNEKNIEKVIKEKFAEQKFDIEQTWLDGMSDSLDEFNEKRRKKRIFFWWFFAGGILLGAVLISKELLFSIDRENFPTEKVQQRIAKQKNTPSEEMISTERKTQTGQQSNAEIIIAEKTIHNNTSKSAGTSSILTEKQSKEEPFKFPKPIVFKPILTKDESDTLLEEIEIKLLTLFTHEVSTKDRQEKHPLIDTIALKGPKLFTFEVGQHPILIAERKEETSKLNDYSKWSVGLTAGPSFTSRSLMLPTDNVYTHARKEFEKGRINWNTELEVSRKLGRFNVFSGVSLASLGENVQYEAIATTTDGLVNSINDVSYWDYDSTFIQGQWIIDDSTWTIDYDTVQIPGAVTVYDSSILAANGKTQYSYFELPIGVGFRLIEHKRLQLSATVGLSVGIRVKQKGKYLINGGGVTSAQSNKMSLNSMYGLDLRYYMTEKSSLSLRPTLKLNHMNHSDLDGAQRKYSSWGLKIGWFIDL